MNGGGENTTKGDESESTFGTKSETKWTFGWQVWLIYEPMCSCVREKGKREFSMKIQFFHSIEKRFIESLYMYEWGLKILKRFLLDHKLMGMNVGQSALFQLHNVEPMKELLSQRLSSHAFHIIYQPDKSQHSQWQQ